MPLRQPLPSKRITNTMLGGLSDKIYPQQLYTLGLEDLSVKGIGGATLAGWRFMGSLAGSDVAIHVDCGYRGKPPAVTEFSHGSNVTNARNAIRKILKLPEVRGHHYELRLLAIPGLSVEAVWLKSQARRSDLMVPYLTAAGLRSMQVYPVDKFVKTLERAARKRLSFDDSPRLP